MTEMQIFGLVAPVVVFLVVGLGALWISRE
jgi:hypothetical protein